MTDFLQEDSEYSQLGQDHELDFSHAQPQAEAHPHLMARDGLGRQ